MAQTLRVRFTTDDASDSTPTWTTATTDVRSFTVSRGRDSELSRVETGTATIVLNNRSRTYDPTLSSSIRPMNRWWIEDTVTGETVFYGYATRYEMEWPSLSGKDAVTIVQCADEMMVLALARLPVMDPPTASTYADVVLHDEPQGYWRFQETALVDDRILAPTVGGVSMTYDTSIGRASSPILGDADVDVVSSVRYGARSTTARFFTFEGSEFTTTPSLPVNGPGDAAGLSSFTFETWFKSSEATPAANRSLATGPLSAGSSVTWYIDHTTAGKVLGSVRNSGGTSYTTTNDTVLSANTWYHVALVVTGSAVLVYVNGQGASASASFSGVVAAMDTGAFLQMGPTTAVGGTRYYDEPAFYRYALSGTRVLAHYTAGSQRGFAVQMPGARVTSVLGVSGSIAASSVRGGSREMLPTFKHGQSPLEELRAAEAADNVDAVLFVAKDGTVTFLDDGHRSAAPWNTVQATFDDDGTDLPYSGLQMDRSDSFLANDIQVTRVGGVVDQSTDATSIATFMNRPLQITGLELTTDSDVASIGNALLAKYKDPMTRITSLTVNLKTSALATAVLGLDIGDRIRVLHTQPNGGRIDQTLFVQRIQIEGRPVAPWIISLGVSPL